MAAISFDVADPIMSPDLFNIHKYCIRVTFTINATTYPSGSLFHCTSDRTFQEAFGFKRNVSQSDNKYLPRTGQFYSVNKTFLVDIHKHLGRSIELWDTQPPRILCLFHLKLKVHGYSKCFYLYICFFFSLKIEPQRNGQQTSNGSFRVSFFLNVRKPFQSITKPFLEFLRHAISIGATILDQLSGDANLD